MLGRIITTLLSKGLTGLCRLGVLLLTAHFLGPSGRGEISLVLAAIAAMVIATSFGGGPSIVFLAPRNPAGALILNGALWTLVICAIGTAMLYASHLVSKKYVIHVFFLSLLNGGIINHFNLFVAKEKMGLHAFLTGLESVLIVSLLAFYFFILGQSDPMVYIYSLYIAFALTFLLSLGLILPWLLIDFRFSVMPSLFWKVLSNGLPAQTASLLALFIYRMPFYFLESHRGTAEVGIFSVGVALSEAVWLFGGSIALNVFSRVANQSRAGEGHDLVFRMGRLSFMVTAAALLIMVCIPPSLYAMVFGVDFARTGEILRILSPGILCFSLHTVISHYFSATGRYGILAFSAFIGFLLCLLLSFLLIPLMGMHGAAMSSSLAYILATLVQTRIFLRESGKPWKTFIPGIRDLRLNRGDAA